MKIKAWFINKNFTQNERMVIETAQACDEITIERETEKALFLRAESDWGTLKFWCPKSCLMSEEEIAAESQKKNAGLNYNESLVKFAKENGVKGVRTGMKTATLIQKITEAGLEVPARA